MLINKAKFELQLANKELLLNELCKIAGVPKITLVKALGQNRNCRPKTVGKVAKALGVSVEDIIVKEGENIESGKG